MPVGTEQNGMRHVTEALRRQAGLVRIASIAVLTVLACLGTYAAFRSWNGTTADANAVPAPPVTASRPVAPPADGPQAGPGGDPAPRQRVTVSDQRSHGDWRHSCLTRQDGARACSIVQTLLQKETRSLLLSWRIVGDDRSLTSIWQTPKNVVLARGLRIDAGLPDPVMLPYQGCNASHCVASIRLPDDLVNGLKNVPGLAVTMILADGQPLRLPISTRGLAAAIEDLRAGGDGR